jgi:predicted acetyltransferase
VDYEIRPIRTDEVDRFMAAFVDAFHMEPRDEHLALWRRQLEPERTLAAFAEGELVATSGLLTRELAVPGAVVPMAGVTAVAVQPVHRRRGLLDRMMRGHLAEIRERGVEAVSALWASEAGIYGRWGFGPATRIAELTVRSSEAILRDGPPEARPRTGPPGELLGDLRRAYDAALPSRAGLLARDDLAWEESLSDSEADREGAGRLRALVADEDGAPAGYATFAVRKRQAQERPDDVVELRELVASTPGAARVLWAHLLALSLTRSLHWPGAPEDEPLAHMVTDARAIETRLGDALYVRLVDVPRALAQRAYAGPLDVVLEVEDATCPWNAGRWRLRAEADGARCEATDTAPDLALTVTELGAAYLGGTPLAVLAAAGRVRARSPERLAAVSHAFQGARAPWSFESF